MSLFHRLVLFAVSVSLCALMSACAGDTPKETAPSVLDIRVLPMSSLGEDLSAERALPYTRTGDQPAKFSLSMAGDLLVFSKPRCTPADRPYYFIVHVTPEDESDLVNPAKSFNNEDFKPDFFEDEARCLAVTYAPDYPVSRIKVGQYERSLGSRWTAWVEGKDVLRR